MRSFSVVILLVVLVRYSEESCSNGGPNKCVTVRNADCNQDQSFFVTPTPKNVSAGQNVEFECIIKNSANTTIIAQGWEFYLNQDSPSYFLRFGNIYPDNADSNYNYALFLQDGVYLGIMNVTAFHHGYYRCISSCIVSEFASLTVTGKILLNFTDESYNNQLSTGETYSKTFVILGVPAPTITLEKLNSVNGEYETFNVTDARLVLNNTGLTFSDLQLSDSGEFRIVTENTEGITYRKFAISVTGSDRPVTTLDLAETVIDIPAYGALDTSRAIVCSVQETAYDTQFYLMWMCNGNVVSSQAGANVRQTRDTNVTATLRITTFEEADNCVYTCLANNSRSTAHTSTVTLIGPPSTIVPEHTTNVSSKEVVISWSTPNAFESSIHYYTIRYSFSSNRAVRETRMVNVSNESTSMTLIVTCPNTELIFSIAAFNYRGLSSNSDEISIDISSICSTVSSSSTSISTSPTSTTGTSQPTIGSSNAATNSMIPIISGAIGGVVVLGVCISVFVMVAVCFIRRGTSHSMSHERRWNQSDEGVDYNSPPSSLTKSPMPMLNGIPSPLPATPGYGPVYIDPQFEFPRENLNLTDILYDGTFTVIYKATAVGIKENKSIEVAVKSIKDEYLEMDDYVSTLILEIEQLGQLGRHANVVSLIKVCTVGRPVYMVTEYMCHGDLLGFLRSTRKHTDMYTVFPGTKNLPTHLKLTSRDLLHIITQIVNGMIFLSEKKVVHGALCARNVLVGTSMEVKIFNIGIQNLDNDESVESLIRWMAPEVFMDSVRTMYGDVWSFGVLMWEVITVGGTPYAEINLQELYSQLVSGMRLNCPTHCSQSMYDIMRLCWEYIPQHRPLFSEIRDHLDNLKVSKMSYLDLRSYNDLAYSQFEDSERQLTSNL